MGLFWTRLHSNRCKWWIRSTEDDTHFYNLTDELPGGFVYYLRGGRIIQERFSSLAIFGMESVSTMSSVHNERNHTVRLVKTRKYSQHDFLLPASSRATQRLRSAVVDGDGYTRAEHLENTTSSEDEFCLPMRLKEGSKTKKAITGDTWDRSG